MWVRQVILAVIGLSAGITVAGGLFAFIIGLGVVSDFADRTHTGKYVLLYEDCIAFGGIFGCLLSLFPFQIPGGNVIAPLLGLIAGTFVGAWSMAIAEILNVFPIFIRRLKIIKLIPYLIFGMAIGKGLGAFVYFALGW